MMGHNHEPDALRKQLPTEAINKIKEEIMEDVRKGPDDLISNSVLPHLPAINNLKLIYWVLQSKEEKLQYL